MGTTRRPSKIPPPGQTERKDLASAYEAFLPKVLKYMQYHVGPSHAEDLTSEVFLRVAKNLPCQHGSLKAWIFRIAHNVSIDHFRSAPVRREVTVDPQKQAEMQEDETHVPHPGLRMDMVRALAHLTDEQREVIVQKFMLGMTTREIEKATGRKPEAIRGLQFRALKGLRTILAEGGYGP
jgi:RNA polymerase sigma-70 factor, ECF subfamily